MTDADEVRLLQALECRVARPLPSIAGLDLACATAASTVGSCPGRGLHDVFKLPNGSVLVASVAVEGDAIGALTLGESVRGAIRAVAMVAPSPRFVLGALNQLLLQERGEQRVSAVLLLLDPASGHALIAGAAHPAPLRSGPGRPHPLPAPAGPALGETQATYAMRRVGLSAGDTLILYTGWRGPAGDRASSSLQRRLLDRLSGLGPISAEECAGELLRAAARTREPPPAGPEVGGLTILVVRLTSVERVSERELALAAPLASWRLGEIRQGVRGFLLGHQLPAGIVDDVVLCVEEACTNVIRHSGSATPGRLTVRVDEQGIEVVLKDEGRGFGMVLPDPRGTPDLLAGGGRGLYLMAALSDEIEFWNEGGACVRLRRSHSGPGRLRAFAERIPSDERRGDTAGSR